MAGEGSSMAGRDVVGGPCWGVGAVAERVRGFDSTLCGRDACGQMGGSR